MSVTARRALLDPETLEAIADDEWSDVYGAPIRPDEIARLSEGLCPFPHAHRTLEPAIECEIALRRAPAGWAYCPLLDGGQFYAWRVEGRA